MLSIPRPAALATLAAVSGAALYGVAAGGVASVDSELRSAADAPAARFQNVVLREDAAAPHPGRDCPAPRRHARPAEI